MESVKTQEEKDLAMDFLKYALGGYGIVNDLRVSNPTVFEGLKRICDSIFNTHNTLPARIRELIFMGIYAAKGYPSGVTRHAERAIQAGATPMEINEILTAVLISRGLSAYEIGSQVLSSGMKSEGKTVAGDITKASNHKTLDEILTYFRQVFGDIPYWVQTLVDSKPEIFLGYYNMRSEILKDNILPRKYKELALVALNASERYQDGLIVHMKGAIASGATELELLEAMSLAILTGGMVAWLEAAKVLKVVKEEQLGASNRT